MFCTKCGTQNNQGTKFCVKCGAAMGAVATPKKQGENLFLSYLKAILNVVTKPDKFLKEEKNLGETKRALIYAAITSGAMMIVNLFMTMLLAPIQQNYWTGKTQYVIGALKELNYLKLIFLNTLIYGAVIFALAGIVYLVGLIFNKKTSYMRLLSITSLCVIPYAAASLVIAPIFMEFSYFFGILFTLVGIVYSVVLFVNSINNELKLEGDKKVFVNAIIFFVIIFIGFMIGYFYVKAQLSAIASLGSLLG